MRYFLTACGLLLGAMIAFAADIPQVNISQVQRAVAQTAAENYTYPSLEKVQRIARNHDGDINSLAEKLTGQGQVFGVQSIWYDGSTFLVVSLDVVHHLHAEVYGPNAPSYCPNYNRTGTHRGHIYMELPELPQKSEGMTAQQVMETVRANVPQEMSLVADLAEFPEYDLNNVLEIANKRFFGDPLRPLVEELVEGYERVLPPHTVHSIWYKDGTLMVAQFQYNKYCEINFYGAKRGKIYVELPRPVYPDEGDLMLAIVSSMLPEDVFLVALAGL